MAAGVEACILCSNGQVTRAKGFELTSDNIDRYYSRVETEWESQSLPPMNKAIEWTVYRHSWSTEMCNSGHHSLFFVCESPQYETASGFTIELGYNRSHTVVPITHFHQGSVSSCCPTLGTVTDSAKNIMDQGLQCLADFGDYHKYSNNCQDFCSKLAKELGLKQPWTDVEKVVTLGAIGAGVLGAVGIGLAALWSMSGNNSKRDSPE